MVMLQQKSFSIVALKDENIYVIVWTYVNLFVIVVLVKKVAIDNFYGILAVKIKHREKSNTKDVLIAIEVVVT